MKESESIPMAEVYWISSDGKIFEAKKSHISMVIDNPQMFGISCEKIEYIYKSEKKNLYSEGKAREKIIFELIRQNWIRLRYNKLSAMWTVNIFNLNEKSKSFLSQWATNLIREYINASHDIVKIDLPGKQLYIHMKNMANYQFHEKCLPCF